MDEINLYDTKKESKLKACESVVTISNSSGTPFSIFSLTFTLFINMFLFKERKISTIHFMNPSVITSKISK